MAAGRCQLQQLGVLPVDMHNSQPLVWAEINGVKARFELDSGAFYSTIFRDAATQYRLRITPAAGGRLYITGIGGSEKAQIATADSFEFLGVPLQKVGFLVVDQGSWGDLEGLLGQNLLHISDIEYDLANGIVRFIKPVGCAHQPLAYWATATPYSSVELKYMDVLHSGLLATAIVNGHSITVSFDTGSPRSVLSLQAAARAGITTSGPGVTFLGLAGGIGPASSKVWVAPLATFQLGGEKVEHAHLLIGDLGPVLPIGYVGERLPDMLLGEDFFLSHRIYVAYSQHKLYFTYNGGPLFNLNIPQVASGEAKPPATEGNNSSQASATTAAQLGADAPTDADGFKRRGMAYASMREFDRALADLTRACELAPGDAENHYERGMVYMQDKEFESALKDFDTAIAQQPDDIDARLARAELLQSHPDTDPTAPATQIRSDLDAVSRLAPPAADVRLRLNDLYNKLGDYPDALQQIDEWLDRHRLESEQATGLNDRCYTRATANRDLQQALDDCNRALALRPYAQASTGTLVSRPLATDPDILDSRGLVYLRLGNLKDAIRDYDSALRANPNMSTSLYGRGLAELRAGLKTRGQADLAAAEKMDGGIARQFAGMGLKP
jgi:tetratricopeptide (TPR) repeat protein